MTIDWIGQHVQFGEITFIDGADILPEFDHAVKFGTGCSFKHLKSNFSFVIYPRIIPAPIRPKSEKIPLWRDVKGQVTKNDWRMSRDLAKYRTEKYMESKRQNIIENKRVTKLQKIRDMLKKL